jgi:hypothetical protein
MKYSRISMALYTRRRASIASGMKLKSDVKSEREKCMDSMEAIGKLE